MILAPKLICESYSVEKWFQQPLPTAASPSLPNAISCEMKSEWRRLAQREVLIPKVLGSCQSRNSKLKYLESASVIMGEISWRNDRESSSSQAPSLNIKSLAHERESEARFGHKTNFYSHRNDLLLIIPSMSRIKIFISMACMCRHVLSPRGRNKWIVCSVMPLLADVKTLNQQFVVLRYSMSSFLLAWCDAGIP